MQSLATSLTQLELGWLAGLWEGEGSFFAHKPKGSNRFYLTASLDITDRDVIERLSDTMGGCKISGPYARKSSAHKPRYSIRLYNEEAAGFMRLLYPLMSNRRRSQIDEAMRQFRIHRINWPRRRESVAGPDPEMVDEFRQDMELFLDAGTRGTRTSH